jgi:cytochrome c-type biogenesis protein
MDAGSIGFFGAAGAGLLSFLSPCVLPLVPAYLCFLGGVSFEQLSAEGDNINPDGTLAASSGRPVLLAACAFVLGFSLVFISFGAAATVIGGLILAHKLILGKIAGAVIIVFGLHFMGLIRIPFLNYEARVHVAEKPAGLLGALVIGIAFAFGWTPCIGPILGTILTVAAREDSVIQGILLLASYALGLGIPFLAAAFAAGPFLRSMAKFRRHMRKIEIVTGALLVLTGVLFVFSSFEILALWLIENFPILGELG